ncbi:MAG: GNAT family N-acetyltransferase [Candidatus Poribacteria bacterium]|nr:GNAT family N-acetyltransferase [Candidatus Poribacteria bacterium]
MKTAPTLHTERLILRSFTLEDAPDVQRSAGDRDVSSTLTSVPYPYEDGMAEEWFRFCHDSFEKGKGVHFAIALITDKSFIGTIGLEQLDRKHEKGELGYWLGKPYWNRGYATEAARAVVAYGFEVLKLNRIYAYYYTRNPASGRVLEKIGMHTEGCLRQHIKKDGNFEDVIACSILKADFDLGQPLQSRTASGKSQE